MLAPRRLTYLLNGYSRRVVINRARLTDHSKVQQKVHTTKPCLFQSRLHLAGDKCRNPPLPLPMPSPEMPNFQFALLSALPILVPVAMLELQISPPIATYLYNISTNSNIPITNYYLSWVTSISTSNTGHKIFWIISRDNKYLDEHYT